MNRLRRAAAPVALLALALFIWLRDLTWLAAPEDCLPLVAALPLLWLLGRPWRLRAPDAPPSTALIAAGGALVALGVPLDLTTLLAIGWTLLLWAWLSPRLDPAERPRVRRMLVLAPMAFPWLTLDGQQLGNLFRLTGAAVAEAVYGTLGYTVERHGTQLLIGGQPISVEAACAGLNTLQSLLVVGSFAAVMTLGRHRRFWWSLPLLVVTAWLGNTLRIVLICALALAYGAKVATGPWHGISGWLVLMAMFVLSVLALEAMRPRPAVAPAPAPAPGAPP